MFVSHLPAGDRPWFWTASRFSLARALFNEDEGTGGSEDTGDDTDDDDTDDTKVKRYDQAEVDRLMGRTRKEARRAAERSLSEELGVTVDEARDIIKARKETEEKHLSELEKRERAAEERERAATSREAAATAALLRSNVIAALGESNARPDRLRRATQAVLTDLADTEGTEEDISEAVARLLEELPDFFRQEDDATNTNGSKPPRPPGATAGRPANATRKPPASGIEAGRARAKARQESTQATNPLDGFRVVGRS